MAPVELKETASKIKKYEFCEEIMNSLVKFQILQLEDSLYIWIGDDKFILNDMSMAMTLPPNQEVTTTHIIGSVHTNQTPSDTIAHRLTTKLKKPVYISYNLPAEDSLLLKNTEIRLIQEIKQNPDHF